MFLSTGNLFLEVTGLQLLQKSCCCWHVPCPSRERDSDNSAPFNKRTPRKRDQELTPLKMTALVIMTEATYGGIPVILLKNLSDCPFLLSMTLVYSYPETKTRLLFLFSFLFSQSCIDNILANTKNWLTVLPLVSAHNRVPGIPWNCNLPRPREISNPT